MKCFFYVSKFNDVNKKLKVRGSEEKLAVPRDKPLQ